MTCIVGLVHGDNVYIGGDSAGSNGWQTRPVANPKVFRVGEFVIGYTSSFRLGQILAHHLSVKPQHGQTPQNAYMVTEFVETVRTALKEFGYARIDSNQEDGDCQFLVGYRGHLYEMQADLSIIEPAEGYTAVGSGAYIALGALAALDDLSPKKRIKRALKISAYLASGVRPPFHVVKLRGQK